MDQDDDILIAEWFPGGWKKVTVLKRNQTIEELLVELRNSRSTNFRIFDKRMKTKKANALFWNGKSPN